MMLRKRLLPKNFMDFGAVTFVLVMIQVIYWFELFLVLPQHYPEGGIIYYIHCCIGTWLLFNVVGNYVIVFLLDTSIQGRFLSSEMKQSWRFCDVCEAVTPPRSWHCPVCDVCILKRDHHCNFTACCIGHENQRYFIMFLVYLSIGTVYSSYFNVIFLWRCTNFSLMGVFQLVFPVAIFMFGGDTTQTQLYRLFCVITMIGMVAAVSLGCYHIVNLLNGQVMHERVRKITEYDLGTKENIRQVFGDKWYLTWLSPFVTSPLPCDGIEWNNVKKSTSKSK